MDILKVWQSTTLQPFELQEHIAPFWKPPDPFIWSQEKNGMEGLLVANNHIMASFLLVTVSRNIYKYFILGCTSRDFEKFLNVN